MIRLVGAGTGSDEPRRRGRRRRTPHAVLLVLGGAVRSEHRGVVGFEFLDDAVALDVDHEQEQCRVTRFDGVADLLDELVVDADVGELPRERPGDRTDRHPEDRREEDEPDEQSPEAPAERTGSDEALGLLDLRLALAVPDDDRRVAERDEFLFLEFDQLVPDVQRPVLRIEREHDEFVHDVRCRTRLGHVYNYL